MAGFLDCSIPACLLFNSIFHSFISINDSVLIVPVCFHFVPSYAHLSKFLRFTKLIGKSGINF